MLSEDTSFTKKEERHTVLSHSSVTQKCHTVVSHSSSTQWWQSIGTNNRQTVAAHSGMQKWLTILARSRLTQKFHTVVALAIVATNSGMK